MRRRPTSTGARGSSRGIEVLYEDKDILVVDKPAGLLTVATEREKSRTAHSLLTDYIRKGCGRSQKRLFVVHRLDRDTSGVLIFAKSEEAMLRLKAQWKQTEKKYLAVVHGMCEKSSDTITTYLAEDSGYNVYSTSDSTKGRLSVTAYTVLRMTKSISLLEVALLTGRKNQIRVHLADIGHPIVGDEKYGKEDGSQPRMALHARTISFSHPFSGKRLSFEAEVPVFFEMLVGRIDRPNVPAENSTAPLKSSRTRRPR
jgi:tRNA pseudouridine32 synthase/23S rRNA pseudouridine746 synthase/23S rRNA pseudouridine1911/1915/1917 synthase